MVIFLLYDALNRGRASAAASYAALAFMTSLAVGMILWTQVNFERDWHVLELATIGIAILILISCLGWFVLRPRTLADPGQLDLILAIATLLTLSLVVGLNKGLTDAGRDYQQSLHNYFVCDGGRLVIRPVGANYLTLDTQNHWAVVDASCHAVFELHD